MIGVKNEKHVQGAFESGIGAVLQFAGFEEHVQEVARIRQFPVRIDVGHSQAVPVSERGQGRHLADQAPGLLAPGFGVEDFLGVGIERRQSRDRRNHHAHGMGIVMKPVEEFLDALVNERVVRDVIGPILKLRRAWAVRRTGSDRRFRGRCSARPVPRWDSRGNAGCPHPRQ